MDVWKKWPEFNKDSWNKLSYYLRKLPQKQFFGMKFVLNVTGEHCKPQWCWHQKPKCWHTGWPWPWPGHSGCGSNPTTKGVTGKVTTTPTAKTVVTTTAKATTTTKATTTSVAADTTTKPTVPPVQTTQSLPTSPAGDLETTTCPWTIDIFDTHYCNSIKQAYMGFGPLMDCQKYYDNATIVQFYNECVQFQCKYQRAYKCYGTWKFVENCSHYLQEDESTYFWRQNNLCPENSTPFPAITFTDINYTPSPYTSPPTVAAGKRSVDDGEDEDENAVTEGTDAVAFGIKNNWCVPRLYSWWWKRHGGSLPGHSNEDDDDSHDWSNGWDGSWGHGDNGHGNGNSNGDDDDNSNNSNGHDDSGDNHPKPVKKPVKKPAKKPIKKTPAKKPVKKNDNHRN